MKRLILIILPVAAFIIFAFFYSAHIAEMDKIKKEKTEVANREAAVEEKRKADLRKAALDEADRQKAEIAKKAQEAEEKAKNEREEEERGIIADTESALAESRRLLAEITKLQNDLRTVRVERDRAQKEALLTKLDIERSRTEKRNSEREILRFYDMISSQLNQSTLLVKRELAAAEAVKKP